MLDTLGTICHNVHRGGQRAAVDREHPMVLPRPIVLLGDRILGPLGLG